MFHRRSTWNQPEFYRMSFRFCDSYTRNRLSIFSDMILRFDIAPNDKHLYSDARMGTEWKERKWMKIFDQFTCILALFKYTNIFYASIATAEYFLSICFEFITGLIFSVQIIAFEIDLRESTVTGDFRCNCARFARLWMTSSFTRMNTTGSLSR